jgi:hypothetical protein
MYRDSIFKNQETARVNKISAAEREGWRERKDKIFKPSRSEKVE